MSLFRGTGDARPELPGLDDARALAKRARREARHWTFRAVMLALISGLAFARGWLIFGAIFLALTVMGLHLARTTRRRAAEMMEKVKLLEAG